MQKDKISIKAYKLENFLNDLHIKKLLIRSFLLWRVQIINIFLS